MKHIIILGDGMADHPIGRLGGKTLLEHARPEYMDMLAAKGRTGRLITIPEGFSPGSEVANTSILGYDLNEVYEGRGPLEAASIGYDMRPDDLALRCNIITTEDGRIKNHHGGHLTTEEGDVLIRFLDEKLGNDRVKFITGIQYRHLLIIRGGNKHIVCAPPHDNPEKPWRPLLVKAGEGVTECGDAEGNACGGGTDMCGNGEPARMTAEETAELINSLIIKSQELLAGHPFNAGRKEKANCIWPWGGGYRPKMKVLQDMYPQIKSGSVISAVDLIRGIGRYAGLKRIVSDGMTGLADTDYEGKARAAIDALKAGDDFVFLHIEASDEAGHDGDIDLKLKTIDYLDKRIIKPIYEEVAAWDEPVCIAILPDHPTPVEVRTHVDEPVPFIIWHKGIEPDGVSRYDEVSCAAGAYGLLRLQEFMQTFMNIK
ncbi:MAG: cofactor-independent phosphoglycerate mutase [Prevotella sp.]|nr:cofactor-independent phosphoglycerate mutase [Prevotella sp.]